MGFRRRLAENLVVYYAAIGVLVVVGTIVFVPIYLAGGLDGPPSSPRDALIIPAALFFYGAVLGTFWLPIAYVPFLLAVELAGRPLGERTLRMIVIGAGVAAGLVAFAASPDDPILLTISVAGAFLGRMLRLPSDGRNAGVPNPREGAETSATSPRP